MSKNQLLLEYILKIIEEEEKAYAYQIKEIETILFFLKENKFKIAKENQFKIAKFSINLIDYIYNIDKEVLRYLWDVELIYSKKHLDRYPEDLQIEIINKYPYEIENISNPSEKLQLIAIKKYPDTIQCIKNPTELVKLTVLKAYPYLIKYISNPTEEIQMEVIERDFLLINYINEPTEKVFNLAYKKLLEYIKKER